MCHILLVEDDVHLRHSVKQLLEDAAHRVSTATNGMEALLRLRPTKPDLVILDLMMPTFSGWEFLRELRAHPDSADTPVLVASAFDEAPVGFEVQGFIRKPFDANQFLAMVERLSHREETLH